MFLGTHNMNMNNLIKSKRYYEKYLGKKVKYVFFILKIRNLHIEWKIFQIC